MQEKGFFREIYRPLQNIFTKGVFQSQIFRTLIQIQFIYHIVHRNFRTFLSPEKETSHTSALTLQSSYLSLHTLPQP